MTSYPEGPLLPEDEHAGLWGKVQGTVTSSTGEPVEGCAMTFCPVTPPDGNLMKVALCSNAEGFYYRPLLPPATYTVKAYGRTAAGSQLYGEASGVVVTIGHTIIVDITVEHDAGSLASND
jgi:Carboxypeptidase regulatory-like domain